MEELPNKGPVYVPRSRNQLSGRLFAGIYSPVRELVDTTQLSTCTRLHRFHFRMGAYQVFQAIDPIPRRVKQHRRLPGPCGGVQKGRNFVSNAAL
eukprot:XP_001706783.1 Hypothetical protein GL50803_39568 [Giardia lamblia ATCC 50803]